MSSQNVVFVDTTIQISRFFKSEDLKRRIDARLSHFDFVVTGLVVRNEFRRRVLSEAWYLLRLIDQYKSVQRVQQHVVDQLTPWHQRKRTISLELLSTFYPQENDTAHADRLRSLLRSLLVGGLEDFDNSLDSIFHESNCACGKQSVKELKPYKRYDIGSDSCKELHAQCGIVIFLDQHKQSIQNIASSLKAIPQTDRSQEINDIIAAIEGLQQGSDAPSMELCKRVGDFLIALESLKVSHFYTQNIAESRHLCRILGQQLIYRPNNPEQDDQEVQN